MHSRNEIFGSVVIRPQQTDIRVGSKHVHHFFCSMENMFFKMAFNLPSEQIGNC